MRYFVLLLFTFMGFWGCQPDEACISSATNRVVVDFYRSSLNGPVRDTLVVGQVRSPASDSLFWNSNSVRTNRIFLWLNPDRDTTTVLFTGPAPTVRRDTLVLAYQRRYRLTAPDCPLEVLFQDLRVVRSSFANTLIINTELREPSNDTDVQVFY